MDNFDFISDSRLRLILERDYLELNKCFDSQCYKSVLIISGSLIEALVVEFLINKPPPGYSEKKILSLNLGQLIELALDVGLIDERIKSLSTVVKNYRNLIHPGRELRLKEQFDKETASVSISLVRLILKGIKSNYVKVYGYSAKEIMQKISNDNLSIGIFSELVEKLNYNERLKLLDNLIAEELSVDFDSLKNPKQFVDILKPFINKDDLVKHVLDLHRKVETGERWEILGLLKLFKEDINLLEKDKRTLIAKYSISILKDSKNLSELDDYRFNRTFSFLAELVESTKLYGDYKSVIIDYYWGAKVFDNVKYFYYQLVNGFSKETKENMEIEFEDSEPFLYEVRFLNDKDESIPF